MKIIPSGYLKLLAAGAVVFTLSGCISTPVTPQRAAATPVMRVKETVAAQRKSDLYEAIIDEKIRGIAVYPGSWKNHSADDVISRVKSYNFNRVYFVLTSERELDDNLVQLVKCANNEGIAPYIFLRQRDYYPRHRGNFIVRFFRPEYPQTENMGCIIKEFAQKLEDEEAGKLAGFTILLEPHRFNLIEQRKGGIHPCFVWSNDAFGIGGDNDQLIRKSIADAKKLTGSEIPFTPAIADFYHEWAVDGKLSTGKIGDIAEIATNSPEVILMMSGNKPSTSVAGVVNELKASKDKSVILLFAVADHLSVNKERFRRRNFTDFVKAIKYGNKKLSGYPAKAGIITGPLRALEYMCYEEE